MRSAEEWAYNLAVGEALPIPAEVIKRIQRDAFEAGARAAIRYCDERAPIPGMDSRLDVEFTAEELAAREFEDA